MGLKKEQRHMNTIIKTLSQIEEKSNKIIADGTARKKALEAEYEERSKNFSENLAAETEQKLNALRSHMEQDMNARLSAQEQDASEAVARLEHHYKAHHEDYVNQLFQAMVEV